MQATEKARKNLLCRSSAVQGLPEEFLQLLRIVGVVRPTALNLGASNTDRLRINAYCANKVFSLLQRYAHASFTSTTVKLLQESELKKRQDTVKNHLHMPQ